MLSSVKLNNQKIQVNTKVECSQANRRLYGLQRTVTGCLESSGYVVNNLSSHGAGFISGLKRITQQIKLVFDVIIFTALLYFKWDICVTPCRV